MHTGSTVAAAKFESKLKSLAMSSIYAITTPLGVTIGILMRSSFNAVSSSVLLTQGIFDALSAGILIYTALVEIMAPEITHNPHFRSYSFAQQASQFLAMYLGAGLMALISLWA